MEGYKIFTHDLRSPIRWGKQVWNGQVPFHLPSVDVNTGPDECGAGWNFCRSAGTALRIAGLWPNGRPSRLYRVEAEEFVERGDKIRSATLTILEEITDLRPAIEELSAPFGDLSEEMVSEQLAWREALGRPNHDQYAIEEGLRNALQVRGLDWHLKQYVKARDAWAAWDAGAAINAWAAWAAWDAWDAWAAMNAWTVMNAWDDRAAMDARNVMDSWAARNSRDARAAWAAWAAWDAINAWAAWDARTAWDAMTAWYAMDALSVYYCVRKNWINYPDDFLTAGIRDAYKNGLNIAIPTGSNELGWIMDV